MIYGCNYCYYGAKDKYFPFFGFIRRCFYQELFKQAAFFYSYLSSVIKNYAKYCNKLICISKIGIKFLYRHSVNSSSTLFNQTQFKAHQLQTCVKTINELSSLLCSTWYAITQAYHNFILALLRYQSFLCRCCRTQLHPTACKHSYLFYFLFS